MGSETKEVFTIERMATFQNANKLNICSIMTKFYLVEEIVASYKSNSKHCNICLEV